MRPSLPALVVAAVALGPSCKASVSADVGVSSKEQVADFDQPIDPATTTHAEAEDTTPVYALLGARHDLRLGGSGGTRQATCRCLAAALGQAGDAAFEWQSVPPKTNPDTQLVIALASDGLECPGEPKDSLGASYWGYRRNGDDIVVLIETARFGRPMTGGAVIPKPMGEGQVYVRPAGKSVPYGKPLDATQKDCKIGNPGPPRTSAPSIEETEGDDDVPVKSEDDDDEFIPTD